MGLALGEALRRDGVVDCAMLPSFPLVVVDVGGDGGGGGGGGVPCFITAYV